MEEHGPKTFILNQVAKTDAVVLPGANEKVKVDVPKSPPKAHKRNPTLPEPPKATPWDWYDRQTAQVIYSSGDLPKRG